VFSGDAMLGEMTASPIDTVAHECFMYRAIELAKKAAANGDHPFSALLVHHGEIVFECLNTVNTRGDRTRHPELDILRKAARMNPGFPFSETVLYASTEPCAMCTGGIYWSGIPTLVYGCPTETLAGFTGGKLVVPSRKLLAHGKRPVEVIGPVLPEQAAAVHAAFW
jgi:tRNA(Arg) A34 adenosine deaminase TadA